MTEPMEGGLVMFREDPEFGQAMEAAREESNEYREWFRVWVS